MVTKSDSVGPPASRGSALTSAFMECPSEADVPLDESRKIVALGGGTEC